jgi:hypothetical protein
MLDLETLGTAADACIMSIGAVRFDLDFNTIDDDGFYASVGIESNLMYKRRIQEETLIWWMKQGAAAQGVFHEDKQSLPVALADFADWMGPGEFTMWSNGADFDIPMIAHAYITCAIPLPWKYYNSRCFRTYKNLPGAKEIKLPFTGTKHNALFDAVYQAQTAQAIHTKLFGKVNAKVPA